MRTFEFSDAKSRKFWNIAVNGKSFTVTYGKINTAGRTQTKPFASAAKAQAEADKLIKKKLNEGYVETTPQAVTSDDEAFHRALEEKPYDLAVWSAFADYLTEQGNPRGEFMQVQIALEDETLPKAKRQLLHKQEGALLKGHLREWLGRLAPLVLDRDAAGRGPTLVHTFTRGWLTRLEARDFTSQQAMAINGCPEARHLRELAVAVCRNAEAFEVCTFLPRIRALELGRALAGHRRSTCELDWEQVLPQLTALEELYLYNSDVSLAEHFAYPLPHLRWFEFVHVATDDYLPLMRNTSLQNLETLDLHPGERGDRSPSANRLILQQVRALCFSPNFPKLQHLSLPLSDFGDDSAEALVKSGRLKGLKTLSLFDGQMTRAGVMTLVNCPEFRQLEWFHLRVQELEPASAELLRATGIEVEIEYMQDEDDEDFDFDDDDDFYDDDWE